MLTWLYFERLLVRLPVKFPVSPGSNSNYQLASRTMQRLRSARFFAAKLYALYRCIAAEGSHDTQKFPWAHSRAQQGCAAWAATQHREGASPGQVSLSCKLPDKSIGGIHEARPARPLMWRSLLQHCALPCHRNLGTCASQPLDTRAYCALRDPALQAKTRLAQLEFGRARQSEEVHLDRHIKYACWRAAGRRVRCYAGSCATAKQKVVFLGTPEVSNKPERLLCWPGIEPDTAVSPALNATLCHDRWLRQS